MKVKQTIIMLVALIILNSCYRLDSQIRLTHQTDRPVMLGKVQTIGGSAIPHEEKINNIQINRSQKDALLCFLVSTSCDKTGIEWFTDDNSGLDSDKELKMHIAEPDSMVKVDEVYFYSSHQFYWPIFAFGLIQKSSTGIEVSIYKNKIVNRAEDNVDKVKQSGEKL